MYIHIINILHSKNLLAKSKYQIHHNLNGGYIYVQGVFRMGVIVHCVYVRGVCTATIYYVTIQS